VTTATEVTNYGWCEGDWYVYGGVGGILNRSAFAVNASRSFAAITDGQLTGVCQPGYWVSANPEIQAHAEATLGNSSSSYAGSPRIG
jgi:hypothetical protein